MESTVFPTFSTRSCSAVVSLDDFVLQRYRDAAEYRAKWAALDATAGTGPTSGPSLVERLGDLRLAPSRLEQRAFAAPQASERVIAPPPADAEATCSNEELELDGRDLVGCAGDLAALLRSCPRLRFVSLRRCVVDDACLREVAALGARLSGLDVSHSRGYSPAAFAELLYSLPALTSLQLNGCAWLLAAPLSGPSTAAVVVEVGPESSGAVPAGDTGVLGRLPLAELTLSECTSAVTDALITALAPERAISSGSIPASLDAPGSIHDSGGSLDGAPAGAAGAGAGVGLHPSPSMRSLYGYGSSGGYEGDAAGEAASEAPAGPPPNSTLRLLDTTACTRISDAALTWLGARAPDLEVLRLSLCDQACLTDKGVAALAGGCQELRAVDLRGCTQLTNAAVLALAKHCPLLEDLCLAGMGNIDDTALAALAKAPCAATLTRLDLTRCVRINTHSVQKLLASAPRLAMGGGDGGGLLALTLTAMPPADVAALKTAFPAAPIRYRQIVLRDPAAPALEPSFRPPPPDQQFAARKVFARYGSAAGAGTAGKGKAGAKKKK